MKSLRLAVSAGLASVAVAETPTPVTFNHDIAPIVFAQCMSCHRAGEVGPFPLTNFSEVKRKSKTILKVIDAGRMPPWPADSHGEFLHERRLTALQTQLFHDWVAGGLAEGDAKDLPATPHFTEGWQLGNPDLVLEPDQPYELGAEGGDVYRCFVLPSGTTEDRYVEAVEIRPSNRAVVHHALVFLDTTGAARKLDAADPGPGYTSFGGVGFTPSGGLGGWAPGIVPAALPEGVGYFLPKGADIVLQVHYHRSGKAETDRTRIGIFFAKKPVDKRYRSLAVSFRKIDIPAGDADYEVHTSMTVPRNVTVLTITPHMHWLGREMTVKATPDGGQPQRLIHIPDWDFNWQTIYHFKDPVRLPAGTVVRMSARFDNSTGNPRNPSTPPKEVFRGEQTTDEMCIAFIGYTIDSEHLTQGIAAHTLADFPRAAAVAQRVLGSP